MAGSSSASGREASSSSWWWHDLRRFDEQRLRAAIEQVRIECRSREERCPGPWAQAANEHLAHTEAHGAAREFDAAWTALTAAQRQLIAAFDATELTVEAARLRREAAAKLHGWRAQAVNDALFVTAQCPPHEATHPEDAQAIEELRVRVKAAREVVDGHADNIYRRLHLLRGHLLRALAVLVGVLLFTLLTVAGTIGTDSSLAANPDPMSSIGSLVLVMVLGALGAALSGVLTLLVEDPERRIPDVRAQRLLVWLRPFVGAAAAVVVVVVFRSGLGGVTVEPQAVVAIAIAAGFSERLVGRAVATATAALVR